MKQVRRGMTTLEISVVVAIVGLFASMAVVNMDGVSRKQRERAALREISIQALQARASARTGQYPVRMVVLPNPAGAGSILRWEQLACDAGAGNWGGLKCPSHACQEHVCGQGGCECISVGDSIPIPYTLDVSSLHFLCWMGQGAQPRQTKGGRSCVHSSVPPQKPYKITQKADGKLDHMLQVDGLTGRARMVDCTKPSPEDICTP